MGVQLMIAALCTVTAAADAAAAGTIVGTYPSSNCPGPNVGSFTPEPNAGDPIPVGGTWDSPDPGSILWRANEWVRQQVPYCVSASWRQTGLGTYRMDCSGFISMAWNLDGVPSTAMLGGYRGFPLPGYVTQVSWSALRPGDALVADGHARLFLGWLPGQTGTAGLYAHEPAYNDGAGYTVTRSATLAELQVDSKGRTYKPLRYNRSTITPPPAVAAFTATYGSTTVAGSPTPPTLSLPTGGGQVRLSATVDNASSATFSASPTIIGTGQPVAVTSRVAAVTITVPPNTDPAIDTYSLSVSAKGSGDPVLSDKRVTIRVAAPPPPAYQAFTVAAAGRTGSTVSVPATGTTATISVTATDTRTITFDGVLDGSQPVASLPVEVNGPPGGDGVINRFVTLPANPTDRPRHYDFTATLEGYGGVVTTGQVRVTVAPSTANSTLVWNRAGGNYVVQSWLDFTPTYKGSGTFPAGADTAVTGDWDGDGASDDSIVWDRDTGAYQVYSFSRDVATPRTQGTWAVGYTDLVAGDWDGDGLDDDTIMWNTATGLWVVHTWSGFAFTYRNSGYWAVGYDRWINGDWDSDGRIDDMLLWNVDSGLWVVHSWAGFAPTYRRSGTFAVGYDQLLAGDFDADGRRDDMFLRNTSNGNWVTHAWADFQPTYKNHGTMSSFYDNATVGDFDADGYLDDVFIWGRGATLDWVVESFTNFANGDTSWDGAGSWNVGYDAVVPGRFDPA